MNWCWSVWCWLCLVGRLVFFLMIFLWWLVCRGGLWLIVWSLMVRWMSLIVWFVVLVWCVMCCGMWLCVWWWIILNVCCFRSCCVLLCIVIWCVVWRWKVLCSGEFVWGGWFGSYVMEGWWCGDVVGLMYVLNCEMVLLVCVVFDVSEVLLMFDLFCVIYVVFYFVFVYDLFVDECVVCFGEYGVLVFVLYCVVEIEWDLVGWVVGFWCMYCGMLV